MLTAERHRALLAVSRGQVFATAKDAPGSPVHYNPRELTVALGFLHKAGYIRTDRTYNHGRPVLFIGITSTGMRALTEANRVRT